MENTTDCLSTMATICRIMIETPEYSQRFKNPKTVLFCQRVLVGTIILYDHVHLIGAFSKKNPAIDVGYSDCPSCDIYQSFFAQIRASVKALKMHANPRQEDLLTALRYSTKHLNDEDTPKATKALFE